MGLLTVKNITKNFAIEKGLFRKKSGAISALNNVSFSLDHGKVVGVVGESGSGKTTLGKTVCRLILPDKGEVLINDVNINSLSRYELAGKVQMIFQDPFASLNPKLTIGTILSEAILNKKKDERNNMIFETLKTVGLPENTVSCYPHQFSGGQRQRIALARALMRHPDIIVADEPLSSLDISIQNQLLNLLIELKDKNKLSFIFVSHDLVTASNLADYILVMKNGYVVEEGPTKSVISSPKESYTENLISAVPQIN